MFVKMACISYRVHFVYRVFAMYKGYLHLLKMYCMIWTCNYFLTFIFMFTRSKLPSHVSRTHEDIYNTELQNWIARFYLICAVLFFLIVWCTRAYSLAGVSVWDYIENKEPRHYETVETIYPVKNKPVVARKVSKPIRVATRVEKTKIEAKETKTDKPITVDLDKLAHAVAFAESTHCKNAYHNNCHGIKSGNTYPCPWTPKGQMCKFKTQEESFRAFKVIWAKWYKTYPTNKQALTWTGWDKTVTWQNHVSSYYNKK